MAIALDPINEPTPARPGRVKLYDENWTTCGKMLCMKPAEAKRSLDNKIEIARWMGDANALIDYYEKRNARKPKTPAKR